MYKESKDKLKDLFSQGKTALVIENLENLSNQLDNDLQHEIILQAGRFRTLMKEKRNGVLSHEEENVQIAKINVALLEIINQLPNKEFSIINKKEYAKWVAILITLIGILAGIAEFSGYSLRDVFSKENTPQERTVQVLPDTLLKENQEVTTFAPAKEKVIPSQNVPYPSILPKAAKPNGVSTNTVKEKTKPQILETSSPTSNNTTINNLNGQLIDNPSAPITIYNNFSNPKDTTKK